MGEHEVESRSVRGGRVREIRLVRPPVNVLDLALLAGLERALAETREAVVVVRGAGKMFSAGVDVADHVPERVGEMLRGFHAVLRRLETMEAVSIAAVQGGAMGGGLELALACDLAVVTADARLALPEIALGVFPPWAAARFPRRYGGAAVADLVLTGEEMTGDRAHALGLVARLAPPGNLAAGLDPLLDRLLGHSDAALRHARRALAIGRRAATGGAGGEPAGGGAAGDPLALVENLYLDELMATEDAAEGIRAFMERRPPAWRHR